MRVSRLDAVRRARVSRPRRDPQPRGLPVTDAAAFDEAVNMTASQVEAWLRTDESKAVGFTHPGERESRGRQSARKIVRILRRGPRGAADAAHMRKVVGYVRRHLAQRPRGDVSATRWRWSLMNWGHDPLGRGAL